MKEQIFENLQNPEVLEHLYRKNKSGFKTAFSSLPEEVNHLPIVQFWNTRLYFKEESVITKNEWMTVGLICFFWDCMLKFPTSFRQLNRTVSISEICHLSSLVAYRYTSSGRKE